MNKEKYHWLRSHKIYDKIMTKIYTYERGFEWEMNWREMPLSQQIQLKLILNDCEADGLIEAVKFEWKFDEKDFQYIITKTRYRKL